MLGLSKADTDGKVSEVIFLNSVSVAEYGTAPPFYLPHRLSTMTGKIR